MLRIEEVFLPEGSYNTKCTLNSAWSTEEVMVPELLQASENVLRLVQSTLNCQFDDIVSPPSNVATDTMNTFINEVHNPFFQTIIEEDYKKSHCNVPSYSTSTSNSTDYSSSYSDSSSSSCDSSSSSSSSSYD